MRRPNNLISMLSVGHHVSKENQAPLRFFQNEFITHDNIFTCTTLGNNKSPLYGIHSSRGPNLIIHQNTLIGMGGGGQAFFDSG